MAKLFISVFTFSLRGIWRRVIDKNLFCITFSIYNCVLVVLVRST